MFIKKVVGKEDLPLHDPVPRMTEDQLHREIYYIRAEQLARKILYMGMIDEDECKKFMKEIRRVFKPFLAPLMPDS